MAASRFLKGKEEPINDMKAWKIFLSHFLGGLLGSFLSFIGQTFVLHKFIKRNDILKVGNKSTTLRNTEIKSQTVGSGKVKTMINGSALGR